MQFNLISNAVWAFIFIVRGKVCYLEYRTCIGRISPLDLGDG